MKQLRKIVLGKNELQALPKSMKHLSNLTELNLNRTTLGYKYPDLFDKSYNERLFGQENIQDFLQKTKQN